MAWGLPLNVALCGTGYGLAHGFPEELGASDA
jgi:hypothetical protein